MHMLWGMMNTLQIISFMLKFNVQVPENAYLFFKYIEEFLNMRAAFIEDIMDSIFGYGNQVQT